MQIKTTCTCAKRARNTVSIIWLQTMFLRILFPVCMDPVRKSHVSNSGGTTEGREVGNWFIRNIIYHLDHLIVMWQQQALLSTNWGLHQLLWLQTNWLSLSNWGRAQAAAEEMPPSMLDTTFRKSLSSGAPAHAVSSISPWFSPYPHFLPSLLPAL